MINFMKRLDQQKFTRIIAAGSSNTEATYRPDKGQGWLLWVDYVLRKLYGRVFHSINSGSSGQTSEQVLNRFEDTIAL